MRKEYDFSDAIRNPYSARLGSASVTNHDATGIHCKFFAGTTVPVSALFDHLRAGQSVTTFLRAYPSVSPQCVTAVLDRAQSLLTSEADGNV